MTHDQPSPGVIEGADHKNIRWSAELITFFNTEYWNLGRGLAWDAWVRAFEVDPLKYFETMLDKVAATGSEGVELAPAPGGWENASAAFGGPEAFAEALRARGLTLSSSYSPGEPLIERSLDDPGNEAVADAHIAEHAEFLRRAGADIIVLGSVPRARFLDDIDDELPARDLEAVAAQIDRLGAVVGTFGVRLALHTDAYGVCSRNRDIDSLLSLTNPGNVGLCLDSGHISLDSGDAVDVLRRHVSRVPLMHWKDCIAPLAGGSLTGGVMERHEVMLTYFRILGAGTVDWRTWMTVLRDAHWSGWAVNEVDMSPEPEREIEQGLRFFREHLSGIYS